MTDETRTVTVEQLAQALADVEDWESVDTACEWFYPPRVLAAKVFSALSDETEADG